MYSVILYPLFISLLSITVDPSVLYLILLSFLSPVEKIFQAYEILYRQTYIQSPQIVKLVEHAGQA